MRMNLAGLRDRTAWEQAEIRLPAYDIAEMTARTQQTPLWVHFGAGNIFRGYIAVLQQRLLDAGLSDQGIVAAETYDDEIIERIYAPYDNQTLNVTLRADATVSCEVIASVAEALSLAGENAPDRTRLLEVFAHPALQLASFTITEKGYQLRQMNGDWLPLVAADLEKGPTAARHVLCQVTTALYERFRAGAAPLALVSMDNCSHNGELLGRGILDVASAWAEKEFVSSDFLRYLEDADKISFPWTMIDKITPRPAQAVADLLSTKGVEAMDPLITKKQTYIAPFVNAERSEYLVIEDHFPNGRPPLERAGVYLTDRDTVNRTERMKVTTCLNPLHTAMSVYGCLLGYTRISEEMKDAEILALIRRLGYVEGLPVVTDPGILSPRAFLDEVIRERLPNPFLPDAPQRIATDTSQKVGIRFGETIKSYLSQGRDLSALIAIPLALAGWLRYLLGVDDQGAEMEVSPDPMKETLMAQLADIQWDRPQSYQGQLRVILATPSLWGLDLTTTPLADQIESYFVEMLGGAGAVRATLRRHLEATDTE